MTRLVAKFGKAKGLIVYNTAEVCALGPTEKNWYLSLTMVDNWFLGHQSNSTNQK